MNDQETAAPLIMLIDAIKKYGTVRHYHCRPLRDCFASGFCYAVGGMVGLCTCILLGQGMVWLFGLVEGWLQ